MTMIRQPIVSVLGHVDHGKTTLLDYIRGTTVVAREAGAITQHIGATEVPIDTIHQICGKLLGGRKFKVPGLLFIDTPGHHSFTTLRSRGGALSDLAILIIDINEGLKPQTHESINILRRLKTPFIVALNKIDRINGWVKHPNASFHETFAKQTPEIQTLVDEMIYRIIGEFSDIGLPTDRYDRIKDFTTSFGLIPVCATSGEGIPDVLMLLVGLAQRFLEESLEDEDGPALGTVLEIKEERGLGTTADTIIYSGTIHARDTLVIGARPEPIVTTIKALLKPRPLDEIRDPRERFDKVEMVTAAAGVKIAAPSLDGVLAGAPLRVARDNIDALVDEIEAESKVDFEPDEVGLIVKADALGSLEALILELQDREVPIKKVDIGDVTRRDIIETATIQDPLRRVLLAFNVKLLPDAKDELASKTNEAVVFDSDIIYKILEDYEEWYKKTKFELERDKRGVITHPCKFQILTDYIFRVSKPAVFGIRILGGRIRPDQRLLRQDGRVLSRIASIRSGEETLKEAKQGEEVAIAVPGITVGRQVKGGDIMYVDVPENDAKQLFELDYLTYDEREVLQEVCDIKRKETPFWAM